MAHSLYRDPRGIDDGGTYSLVLYAMTLTENVSFIVALRQTSIVFGLFMGSHFLESVGT